MNKIKYLTSIALIACAVAGNAFAQTAANYPVKPVRFIAPFPPGGSTDLLARLVAQKLTEAWGQQVIVENRGGAAGTIGVELAARSAPDGYTIVMGHVGTFGVNPTLYPKLPYDAIRDFAPITVLATVPNGMAVHPSLPVKTARDFVVLAKAKPGELLYASGGSGSASHLAGEYFKLLTKIDMVHVPYKGTGPFTADLVAGRVQFGIIPLVNVRQHVSAGKLKLMAVFEAKRDPAYPSTPTIIESFPAMTKLGGWIGLFGPPGLPRPIVQRVYEAASAAMRTPELKEYHDKAGATITVSQPEDFIQIIRSDYDKMAQLIKTIGLKPE